MELSLPSTLDGSVLSPDGRTTLEYVKTGVPGGKFGCGGSCNGGTGGCFLSLSVV